MSKTVHSDGNQGTGTPGSVVMAAYLNALNNPIHDGQLADGHVAAFKYGGTLASPAGGELIVDTSLGNHFKITGANAISKITISGSAGGAHLVLEFAGAVTFMHDATNGYIICPRGLTITTEAGTLILVSEYAAGKWIVVATNGTLLPNGSAANPPIKGIGGGGLFFLGDGGVGLSVNGVEGLRISGSRRLLINTTTDDGVHHLQVNGRIACGTPGDTMSNALDILDVAGNNAGGLRSMKTTGVGSATAQIARDGGNNSLHFVFANTAGKSFTDIVTHAEFTAGAYTCDPANSATYGAPGARTYSYAGGYLQVSVAGADIYTVKVLSFVA